jgi:thiamine biosynthesis protein ThiS
MQLVFIPHWVRISVNVLVNGEVRQVAEGTTLAELLGELKLPPRGLAVELNLSIVPRIRHAQQILQDGDRLEIVTLVGGG